MNSFLNVSRKTKVIVIDILFLFFYFAAPFSSYLEELPHQLLAYSDEVLECLAICFIGYKLIKGQGINLLFEEKVIIGCYAVFVAVTGISSFINGYQSMFYSLVDMLVCIKFIVMYFAARFLITDKQTYDELISSLALIVKVILVLMVVLMLHDTFFEPIFQRFDRYGLYSFQLCFGHPTGLAIASFICFVILLMNQNVKKTISNDIFIYVSLIVCFFTLRGKAIASAACALLFYIYFTKLNFKKLLPIGLASVATAVYLGLGQWNLYFGSSTIDAEGNVRGMMLKDSFTLAKDNFPIGTGFGTFGSNVTVTTYSPLYYRFGYDKYFGSSVEKPLFLSDSFWPIVTAQGGFIGLFAFVGVVAGLLTMVIRRLKSNKYFFTAGLSILMYEVISSLGESAFFHPTVWPMFILLGIMVNYSCFCENK